MHYEGDIYRPPSEAYSLLIQVTIGCAHNKCTFCNMYKAKRFRVRQPEEILADLREARMIYRRVGRIFLCDGDAMCLATGKLLPILQAIRELFPECERVGIYARAKDILRKSGDELAELAAGGLGICYIGAESGSEEVLRQICKGETAAELIAAVHKVEEAGIQASVTFISGLGGRERMEEHAVATGRMIGEMNASYTGLLTLMLDPIAPLWQDVQEGRFQLLSARDVLQETWLMLDNTREARHTVFRSNHASNYLSLRGNLPEDRERMMTQLVRAMQDERLLKDERFRML